MDIENQGWGSGYVGFADFWQAGSWPCFCPYENGSGFVLTTDPGLEIVKHKSLKSKKI